MKPIDLLCRMEEERAEAKPSTGCAVIDGILQGGIPFKSITEIVGESGTRKTQLALQLLVATVRNSGSNALYLHTEFPFPLRRVKQLLACRDIENEEELLECIYVHPLYSAGNLLDVFPRLKVRAKKFGIRLIVIDSIAGLFRWEFGITPTELRRRISVFFKVSTSLGYIATKNRIAVVVTNQVADVMEATSLKVRIGNAGELWSSGREVTPALGLSWASCVNTRLFLWRDEKRFMRVLFAPHLPDLSCEFDVTREGVFGVGRNDSSGVD